MVGENSVVNCSTRDFGTDLSGDNRTRVLPSSVKILFAMGSIGGLLATILFIRMAIELNRVLPPQKKFYIFGLRQHGHEEKRLHEKHFPVSRIRTTWFAVTIASIVTMLRPSSLESSPSRFVSNPDRLAF